MKESDYPLNFFQFLESIKCIHFSCYKRRIVWVVDWPSHLDITGHSFNSFQWTVECADAAINNFITENDQNLRFAVCGVNIWNQQGKYIKISPNKPMFGPVVLKLTCRNFQHKASSFHWSMAFACVKNCNSPYIKTDHWVLYKLASCPISIYGHGRFYFFITTISEKLVHLVKLSDNGFTTVLRNMS